jgi:hypothetical protein
MAQKVERNAKMACKKADDHWAFLVLLFFLRAFNLMLFESAFLILFSFIFPILFGGF